MKTKASSTPEVRCAKCQWVDETDTDAGTSFRGVRLCDEHASAQDVLVALKEKRCKLLIVIAHKTILVEVLE